MGFLSELKRRDVFRPAAAYALAAWLLVQVGEAVFPAFGVPDAIFRGMVIVLLMGFPVVLLVSWVYQMTPDGLKRESSTDSAVVRAGHTGRKLDFIIIGLLAAAVVYFAADKFLFNSGDTSDRAAADNPEHSAAVDRPSIAVLPFKNRSDLEQDAYFVDGIHDDILTQLAKMSSLTVIARTSVEQFRDTQLSISEIARRLGVSALIEGGVQRAGDRVRINIQLIDASSEGHLWAETYDRELNAANIFAIQTEVSQEIVRAMKATLTPEDLARGGAMPTENLAAWETYQLARHHLRQPAAEDNLEAERLFAEAIELDPGFALAHVGLAQARFRQQYLTDIPGESALQASTEAIEQALELDPDLPDALAVQGLLKEQRHEYEQAERYLVRALELNPNSVEALEGYAGLLPMLGRNDEAIVPRERLVMLDPLEVSHHEGLGVSLLGVGRFDEAIRSFRKSLEIDPTAWFSYHEIGHIIASHGRYDLAMPFLRKALELGEDYWMNWMFLGAGYLALEDDAEADRFITEALNRSGRNQLGPLFFAAVLRFYQADEAGGLALLTEAQALDPRAPGAATMLADGDLREGNAQKALERLSELMPTLLVDEPLLSDVDCSCTSIPLALALRRNGDLDRSERLLQLSEDWNSKLPRLGPMGYGTGDVEIYAIRGDKVNALARLKEAVDAGWRSAFWRYQRDYNPALDAIRGEPEFDAVFALIERDMAQQRELLKMRPDNAMLDLEALTSLGDIIRRDRRQ